MVTGGDPRRPQGGIQAAPDIPAVTHLDWLGRTGVDLV
jgi:hypothetical protein